MSLLNLTKNGALIFNRKVSSVKFYDKDQSAQLLGEAGHMGKAGVKINAVPRSTELSGSNKYQLGYDITVEIVSEQAYGMFEFDNLKNKNVWIEFPEVPLFTAFETTLNIEVMLSFGETQGQVKITAQGYAQNLNQAFFSHWYGLVNEPWAIPAVPTTPPDLPESEYHYVLRLGDPYVEIIDPAAPSATDNIIEAKLSLYDNKLDLLMLEPTVTAVEYYDGFNWTALTVTTQYTVIFEDDHYKIHIDDGTLTVLHLKTEIRVAYTLA
ncbi:hypothetical protein IT417_03650 [bacterium]|nr:hypothetical protein [bacterium]